MHLVPNILDLMKGKRGIQSKPSFYLAWVGPLSSASLARLGNADWAAVSLA